MQEVSQDVVLQGVEFEGPGGEGREEGGVRCGDNQLGGITESF